MKIKKHSSHWNLGQRIWHLGTALLGNPGWPWTLSPTSVSQGLWTASAPELLFLKRTTACDVYFHFYTKPLRFDPMTQKKLLKNRFSALFILNSQLSDFANQVRETSTLVDECPHDSKHVTVLHWLRSKQQSDLGCSLCFDFVLYITWGGLCIRLFWHFPLQALITFLLFCLSPSPSIKCSCHLCSHFRLSPWLTRLLF